MGEPVEPHKQHKPKPDITDVHPQYKRAVEKFPTLSKTEVHHLKIHGSTLVRLRSLDAEGGLMAAAEITHMDTPDKDDQIRTALFTAAAGELAAAVLGYPNNKDQDDLKNEDFELWKERVFIEESYLHELFQDRQEVSGKTFAVQWPPEHKNLLHIVEFAQTLTDEERSKYIKTTSGFRAQHYLGIPKDQKDMYRLLINRRIPKEEAYLTDAIERNKRSHGGKQLTFGTSPHVQGKQPTPIRSAK